MARTGSPRAAVAKKTRIETNHRVRTASPRRRAIQTAHAAPPCRPLGGATSSRGWGSVAVSAMGSDRDVLELVVAEREVLARLEPLHLLAVAVDLLAVAPDDVAALFVLHLLGVGQQAVALGLVDLAGRGVDQVDELRVVP